MTESPSAEAIEELERLEKAATPGPWRNYLGILAARETDAIFWPSMSCDAVAKDADVDLIATMRNALPGLIERIRELEEDNASLTSFIAQNQGIYRERVKELEKERDAAVLEEREACAKMCRERGHEAAFEAEEHLQWAQRRYADGLFDGAKIDKENQKRCEEVATVCQALAIAIELRTPATPGELDGKEKL